MKELKSDHFGIEMAIDDIFVIMEEGLKSDHFGIEIDSHSFINTHSHITKIRPFWD